MGKDYGDNGRLNISLPVRYIRKRFLKLTLQLVDGSGLGKKRINPEKKTQGNIATLTASSWTARLPASFGKICCPRIPPSDSVRILFEHLPIVCDFLLAAGSVYRAKPVPRSDSTNGQCHAVGV